MRTGTILIVSFIVGMFGIFAGALLKIMHWANAEPLLIIGVLTWAVFIVTAIYEVRTSKNINQAEKTMWTVCFILIAGITAVVYLLVGRKRVVRNIAVQYGSERTSE